ncbi:MAG: hypothetical protein HQM08_14730 [Candidatus Riflebacteria bacterium]|nr:hypothetical protein [Candidatus Riflebacteria bacterium]
MNEWIQQNKTALIGMLILGILIVANIVVRAKKGSSVPTAAVGTETTTSTETVSSQTTPPLPPTPPSETPNSASPLSEVSMDQNLIGETEKKRLEELARELESLPPILEIPKKVSTFTPALRNPFWWKPVKVVEAVGGNTTSGKLLGIFHIEDKTLALVDHASSTFLMPIGDNSETLPFNLLTDHGKIVMEESGGKTSYVSIDAQDKVTAISQFLKNPPKPFLVLGARKIKP